MKNKLTLRTLVSFSFLLFFLPFLRTCSDRSIENWNSEEVTAVLSEDSNNIALNGNDTIRDFRAISKNKETKLLANEKVDRIRRIQEAKKEFTFNFYSLLVKTLFNDKFDKDSLLEKSFYPLLGYLLVLLSTLVMLVLSFLNRIKILKILSSINIVLLIFCAILLYFCGVLESINQLKVGYYLIFINFIFIVIVSEKILRENPAV